MSPEGAVKVPSPNILSLKEDYVVMFTNTWGKIRWAPEYSSTFKILSCNGLYQKITLKISLYYVKSWINCNNFKLIVEQLLFASYEDYIFSKWLGKVSQLLELVFKRLGKLFLWPLTIIRILACGLNEGNITDSHLSVGVPYSKYEEFSKQRKDSLIGKELN